MPTLSLHIKTKKGGFQIKEPCIIITYYKDSAGYHRALKHRGVDYTFIASREVSEEEFETESNPYRMHFIQYNDWDKLIDDEKKFTDDAEWFNQLNELKNKYPQFIPKQISA